MFEIFKFTEAGKSHDNEDALEVAHHPEDSNCIICSISDGQGGRAGGREAGLISCQSTIRISKSYSPKLLKKTKTWPVILQEADKKVRESKEAGFSTLIGLSIIDSKVFGASSGDSSAIIINSGDKIHYLTNKQAKNPPVGSGNAHFASFDCKLMAPWKLILMTDGVWKFVGMERVISILKQSHGNESIESLKKLAKERGNGSFQDDFTVVLIQNNL